jgi:hypothetical protein
VGGHADSFRTAGYADIPGRTFRDHALEIALDRLEAYQSRGKAVDTGVCLPQLELAFLRACLMTTGVMLTILTISVSIELTSFCAHRSGCYGAQVVQS